MAEIRFENVWKEYGSTIVLENVDIHVADHEFVVLVGPSGIGKTTILRMLLSQEMPTRGRILIDGLPIAEEPTNDRGVVFQRYSVFPHRTVLANVTSGPQWVKAPFLGRLFGSERRELERDARALLDRVGLGDSAHRYPQQLSGGMQQRLAIAQALAGRPKVLLLDEPFGALDPGTRKSMHALVRELWDERLMTIVMVTHDIPEAFDLGTRVLAIDRPRRDPQAPERYGATVTGDFCAKARIVRDNARFEAVRREALSLEAQRLAAAPILSATP
ncbi:lauroyl acyltransferase [Aureimonas sp. SA4125]|uniref:ABC transporter ATP-binding protein n=1 Tax=Aureimonas sp. SA4125 TaxID=2826993 RepID=UPI001CC63C8B|nr:ABC transporter ATP-binding protein [Aureimonas sp. SA4125]BDA82742.1 lauroyl acyltransferase [Aureimonas sp. SA4125]